MHSDGAAAIAVLRENTVPWQSSKSSTEAEPWADFISHHAFVQATAVSWGGILVFKAFFIEDHITKQHQQQQ